MSNRNQAELTDSKNRRDAQGQLAESLCILDNLHAQSEALVVSMLAQMRYWQDYGHPTNDHFEKMELGWEYLWQNVSKQLSDAVVKATLGYHGLSDGDLVTGPNTNPNN